MRLNNANFCPIFGIRNDYWRNFVVKKSAKKFNLTPEQLEKIKQRNDDLDKTDRES